MSPKKRWIRAATLAAKSQTVTLPWKRPSAAATRLAVKHAAAADATA